MAVFVLSDLHLSTNRDTDKSMEVFGGKWQDYMNRIKNNWNRLVAPNDTVIVNGDISWAMTLDEAKSDFDFLNSKYQDENNFPSFTFPDSFMFQCNRR